VVIGSAARTILVGLVLVGCGSGDRASLSGHYPEACSTLSFSDVQCDAIVARAMKDAHVVADDISAVRFVRFDDDQHETLGGVQIARVELVLADGRRVTEDIWCIGVGSDSDRVCRTDAHVVLHAGLDRDVPCAGEPPAGCATVPPSPAPASVAAASPLVVASLLVPLDHVGRYEIDVGSATLPDGALSERSATLVEPQPATYWIDRGVRLEVRPDLPGRPPIGSIYRDRFDGPEPVHAYLVFEVVEVRPGAVLKVADIVVR
jgi:hypothetical protein